MHYYKFSIGDYAAATRHLTMIEHGAYRLLLDLYYTTEEPIPLDIKSAARKAGGRSKDEVQAVETVLREFFTETESGWIHTRCDAEIALFRAKAETNRVVGRLGGRPKKETQTVSSGNPEITQTVSENNPEITLTINQEPLTNNHKPITKNQEPIPLSPKRKTKTRIDQDLKLSEHWAALASDYWKNKCRLDLDAEDQFNRFKNHHLANGTTSNDWQASWTTWYCNAVDFTRPPLQVVHASQQAAPRPIKTMRPAGSEQ